MEDHNDNAPTGVQAIESAPNDAGGEHGDLEHRLAMAVGDAWQQRIDAAAEPLADLRSEVSTVVGDKDVRIRELPANLQEFLQDRISELADDMFPSRFVRSPTPKSARSSRTPFPIRSPKPTTPTGSIARCERLSVTSLKRQGRA